MILISMLTVLLSISLVYAVSYTFKPKNSAQTLTTAEGVGVNQFAGLELTMTLEKTEYNLGEPINITLAITNISNQTINYTLELWPSVDFRVYNDTNSDLYTWSWSQIGYGTWSLVPIDAGESLTYRLVWPQTWNNTPVSEGVPVSPGTYYIVGLTFGLQTTPIQVTIVAL